MKLVFLTLAALLASCTTVQKPNLVTLLESKITDELILDHKYFVIAYDKKHNIAKWVKYTLTKDDLNGPGKRPSRFKPDPFLLKLGLKVIKHDDYTHTGYARGHLAPAEDFSRTQEAIESTFVMSNVIPQMGSVNSGAWAQLERKVRSWACGEENITVITGPIIQPGLEALDAGVAIPNEFYKIIFDNSPPKKAIGFIYSQLDKEQTMENRQIPINRIEELANEKFVDGLPDSKISEWNYCK